MHRLCTLQHLKISHQHLSTYSKSKWHSQKFSSDIADINILDDETMVSFDVVSLFAAIPVEKVCNYIRKKLEDDYSLHSRSNLDVDDIICLLDFVLSNNYFIYNDDIYKQIHGCAMGSPVSPVIANLCMEEIKEVGIVSCNPANIVYLHSIGLNA